MTKNEAEVLIYSKMKEIRDVYSEYAGNTDYVTLSIIKGEIVFWNNYWEGSPGIQFYEELQDPEKISITTLVVK